MGNILTNPDQPELKGDARSPIFLAGEEVTYDLIFNDVLVPIMLFFLGVIMQTMSYSSMFATFGIHNPIEEQHNNIFTFDTFWFTVDSLFDIIGGLIRLAFAGAGMADNLTRISLMGVNYYENPEYYFDILFVIFFIAAAVITIYDLIWMILSFLTINIQYRNYQRKIHVWTFIEWFEDANAEKYPWDFFNWMWIFFAGPKKIQILADITMAILFTIPVHFKGMAYFWPQILPAIIIEFIVFPFASQLDMPYISWEVMLGLKKPDLVFLGGKNEDEEEEVKEEEKL